MKVTHSMAMLHVDDAGVSREVGIALLEDKSVHILFSTKWKEDEEPVRTPLRLTPIAAELLQEAMFEMSHHRDRWEAIKGEE